MNPRTKQTHRQNEKKDSVNCFVMLHLDSRNLWEYFPILACHWLNSECTKSYAQIRDLYYEEAIIQTWNLWYMKLMPWAGILRPTRHLLVIGNMKKNIWSSYFRQPNTCNLGYCIAYQPIFGYLLIELHNDRLCCIQCSATSFLEEKLAQQIRMYD